MITLILVGTLNSVFGVKLVFAKDLPGDNSASKRANNLNTDGCKIFEKESDTDEDKWNFNYTNEWSEFVYVDGNRTRLIVGVNGEGSASLSKLEEVAEKYQAEIVNIISIKGEIIAVVVELPLAFVAAFVDEVRMMKLASYVEPNMKIQIRFVPNDPYWSLQWGPQKIEADWAWNTTVGDSSVLVAVIDTGIDYTHPDLADNYVPLGYDWVNNDSDPLDDFGHGTHCAGIIAAVLNNGIGVAGLAQVQIMAEKIFDNWGFTYMDWIASGIIHAVDMGADIISMSFGGYADSQLLRDAIKYAYDSGVLLVAAAGNDDTNMRHYPACYDEVIAVAATDRYDNKAYFSNWGEWIELAAPGVDIYSTMPTYYVTMNDYGYSMNYDYMSGTSMACPHVAGVAALVWSLYPNKTRDWVRFWLQNTADDLGDPGFDVYYGYGRINARKAVEQTPPAHELIAYGWETPLYVEPEASATINATILNFGENNETSIEVQLLANGTLVDSVEIEFLASGDLAIVSLTWSPAVEGLYNVTLYVMPVSGETSIENNMLSKYIYVGTPVKAVVLHSAGNVIGEIIANWQVLMNQWYLFGDTMIYIDYTTLNKEYITYEDIAATEADVLIISCACDPYAGWEFTDSEIEAITQYVYEGHGLVVTAGTFYRYVPNNNKLAPLLGLDETIMWGVTGTDLLHLINATHPLFVNVPNPLVFSQVATALPSDGRWDQNELVDGEYLAFGHYQESAIVVRRGLVYISPWLEIVPSYYRHHLQLLYNAIIWSRYQKPEHELITCLEAPSLLKPGKSSLLNASVSNMGVNNETDVDLFLLINGTVVNSTRIPQLLAGECYTISYLWTPTVEGIYNVTASASPVLDEEFTLNNVDTKMVLVREIVVEKVLVYTDDYVVSPSERYPIVALDNLGITYTHYSDDPYGFVNALRTQHWDLVIVSHNNYYIFGNNWDELEEYVLNGGLLVLSTFDIDGSHSEPTTLWSTLGVEWSSDMYYPEPVYRWIPTHPIFTTPNTVGDLVSCIEGYCDDGDHVRATTGIPIAGFTSSPTTGYAAIVVGNGGRTVLMSFLVSEFRYDEDGDGKLDAVELWENAIAFVAMPVEHELTVTLDAPTYLELGDSSLLNVTVCNQGLSNETDVDLFLLINGTVVNSTRIPQLLAGECYTISYLWTPMRTGNYNITAYSPPVSEEEYITNNIVTMMTHVFFYRRLYLPHEWIGGGVPMEWHADDYSWEYPLPFDFPFYGAKYRVIYISSNGLISFIEPDRSWDNSISALADKLAIAPAWDDWVTYDPYGIYIWENSTHVGIRWYVRAYGSSVIANFEAILCINGEIQFNYAYSDGAVSATVGISNGVNHIIAEDLSYLNYVDTIIFTPFESDIAVLDVSVYPQQVYVGQLIDINVTVGNEGERSETFTVEVYYQNATSANLTSTNPQSHLSLAALGSHPSDSMWIEPSVVDATGMSVGDKFNVTVWLNVSTNVAAWQFRLIYEEAYLDVTRYGLTGTGGSISQFFEKSGTETWGILSSEGSHNETHDYIMIGEVWKSGPWGRGCGSLAWLEFQIKAEPEPPTLTLDIATAHHPPTSDTYVIDPSEDEIPLNVYNGLVVFVGGVPPPPPPAPLPPGMIGRTVVSLKSGENKTISFIWNTTEVEFGNYTIIAIAVPLPYELDTEDNTFIDGIVEVIWEHDVAILNVSRTPSWVYVGRIVNFTITISNNGNFVENVTITLYYNITEGKQICTILLENLLPGENMTLLISWNTAGVAPRNYTITVVADIEKPDSNPGDNILTNINVQVRILGDINGDLVVDIKDVFLIAQSFGSYPTHPMWNPDADLDDNGRVDIKDIFLVAKNFGKKASS